jgi:outer membrane receptor protein involved in Fe transport
MHRLREDGPRDPALTVPTAKLGVRASMSRTFTTGRLGHVLACGGGLARDTGSTVEERSIDTLHMTMLQREVAGEQRFLDAFLKDTIRVIDSLDVSGGFVIEDWRFLNGHESIVYGIDEPMDVKVPALHEIQLSPELGARYRASDQIAVLARAYRALRPPELGDLYRPQRAIAPNVGLVPERVWAAEAGPEVAAGTLTARAAAFVQVIESPINNVTQAIGSLRRMNVDRAGAIGIETEATWRPTPAWLATVEYSFTSATVTEANEPSLVGKRLARSPRHRAAAVLAFDDPGVVTLAGTVRYVDRSYLDDRNTRSAGAYTLIDVFAARRIARGLAGFVAVENLLDRRYLAERAATDMAGAPRTLLVGVRVDTSRR